MSQVHSVYENAGSQFPCTDLTIEDAPAPLPPPDPDPDCNIKGEWLRESVRHLAFTDLKNSLLCSEQVASDKTLVSTFVVEKELTLAREQLKQVPQDSEENIEFYQVFDALINVLEDGGTAGKNTDALALLEDLAGRSSAGKTTNEGNVLAQSALAMLYGNAYKRNAPRLNNSMPNTSSFANSLLEISPNPATNYTNIVLEQTEDFEGVLSLYSIDGHKVKELVVNANKVRLETTDLAMGTYICQWRSTGVARNASAKQIHTNKLSIIR